MKVLLNGKQVEWMDAVAKMQPHIVKELEWCYPCDEQFFTSLYAEAHKMFYGTPFTVD